MLIGRLLMRLRFSLELVRAGSIVCCLGQARLSPHLLAFISGSISMLGGLFDRLMSVFTVVWFAHSMRIYPVAVRQPRMRGM